MRIRLRYKLFLVILLANATLTAVIVVANNQAFNAGFDAYLNEVQTRRFEPLLEALAREYREQGGWDWVQTDRQRWHLIIERYLSPGDFSPAPAWEPREHDRHGPGEDGYQGARRGPGGKPFEGAGNEPGTEPAPPILLRDAEGRLLSGNPHPGDHPNWLPIETQGSAVAALGVPRDFRLTAEFDRLFAEQQGNQLLWISLAAFLLSGAVAVPFAGALVRPITRLQGATRQLASGHYQVELTPRGSDELAELARDFNALAQALASNLEARQRWIADISHELRTPIAVLQAELEALQDGVRQADGATLQSLHQEIVRLGGLVSDLHELSLSDAGALSYQKAPVDLVEVINEVHNHSAGALADANIELTFDRPDQAVVVHGDRNRLVQLVTNLMQNSLNYTDAGANQAGRIHIQLTQNRHHARLTWSDSAPGVPPQALPRLFERLYRVEASRSRGTGGSGLGLSIVRNVVDAHQGRIEARPADLGGLAIEITFPNRGAT